MRFNESIIPFFPTLKRVNHIANKVMQFFMIVFIKIEHQRYLFFKFGEPLIFLVISIFKTSYIIRD